jgi:hypothetical protein
MMGDDHARISAAAKVATKEIGCKVFRGSPYYRKEGAQAESCLCMQPWCVSACIVPPPPATVHQAHHVTLQR